MRLEWCVEKGKNSASAYTFRSEAKLYASRGARRTAASCATKFHCVLKQRGFHRFFSSRVVISKNCASCCCRVSFREWLRVLRISSSPTHELCRKRCHPHHRPHNADEDKREHGEHKRRSVGGIEACFSGITSKSESVVERSGCSACEHCSCDCHDLRVSDAENRGDPKTTKGKY